jgi:L-ascorbate metabolism protein UlaG (beta-lactamase superfamily)
MKIKHYLYNAFIIEDGATKIAIDPGQNLGMFKMNSLIPESEWMGVTHILVTHGDVDHYKYAPSMAKKTNASVMCGESLANELRSENIMNVYPVEAGTVIEGNTHTVEGLKTEHGRLHFTLAAGMIEMENIVCHRNMGGQEIYIGPARVRQTEKEMRVFNHGTVKLLYGLIRLEKDNIDFARGSIGYKISINGKTVVNLGDAIFTKEWSGLQPDILMLPIGGLGNNTWTMDVEEALIAVRLISPQMVIPCHYSVPFLWKKKMCPADDDLFKREVEKMGIECNLMKYGDVIEV